MKTKRQGLQISIKELENAIKMMKKDGKELAKAIGLKMNKNKRWLIPIINKNPQCSDTWTVEKL